MSTTEYVAAAEAAMRDEAPQPRVEPGMDALGNKLLGEFNQAKNDRLETEKRWLADLRQYRGQYDAETLEKIGNRSKSFVRKTRVKVKTVDARVQDLLFPAGVEKNWNIDATPKPSLSSDQLIEIRSRLTQMAQGQKPTKKQFEAAVAEWAKERAKSMSKTVDDQLAEAKYKAVCIKAIHSGNLYGTGIVKGPLVERKVRTRFVKGPNGKWVAQNESYVVPFVDYVPLWRFYPDMAGATELNQCRFTYELHSMTRHEMASLAQRKSFNKERIVNYIRAYKDGNSILKDYENELRQIGERTSTQAVLNGRYDVLERWGWLDGEDLRNAGVEVPEDRIHESFFSNVWMLPNGEVIKCVLQPINGVTWPYHIYYFDKDESSFFPEGLASIMRDDQTMLNAATRLMLDNAAITAGPMLEVATGLLATTAKADEMYPWKIWLRNNTAPGQQAVRAITLESRLGDLGKMAAMFENNADEVTAIPRYMSGENATSGAAGTAAGMSMLIGNVNIVIKDLIGSWDDGVTSSFIRGMYFWNMQFNPDDSIKGDFDVKAKGTASLVAKEVRTRQLNEFAQLTANEFDMPYIKRHKLNILRAEANEMSDIVKTEDEMRAEQDSDEAKKQRELQAQITQLQLEEAKGKVAKLLADAEVAKTKSQEMLANIELIIAKTVETKVASIFSALQAGGTATATPFVAPAGDEVLQSAGFKDATPDPSIAQLNGPPVQATQGTHQVLNKGASFAVQPRAGGNDTSVDQPNTQEAIVRLPAADIDVPTGQAGMHQGLTTAEID
ncbi:hypothetical protein [Piscinibacter gummiphilus]|uniref:Portal protein n=1 Tax=Piscinibacter gummiphilus TaxID=946333 RepID=A0ABZ0CNB3_9BURK|nr:hypothetical protein [Piscinibacter gummiphilus]WOB06475.1 hypothetical protein RXV79_16255 [Piscinibacter gummiphilus]